MDDGMDVSTVFWMLFVNGDELTPQTDRLLASKLRSDGFRFVTEIDEIH